MSYLICQILVCLLVAALLGFLLGWYLRRLRCQRDCDELRGKLDIAESEQARLQARLRELEADRSRAQLGNISQRAAAAPTATAMGLTSEVTEPEGLGVLGTAGVSATDRQSTAAPTATAMGLTSAVTEPEGLGVLGADNGGGTQGVVGFEIEEIEGIGKGFGQRLRNIGIATTGDLLRECPTKGDSAAIASKISLDADSVHRWVCAADLMRVEGLGKDYAELLVWTDVKTVQQLGSENPTDLAARARAVNAVENRARDVPETQVFSDWVSSAKRLRVMLND